MAKDAGELILAVLVQAVDMERQRIAQRSTAGRQIARESLTRTGLMRPGKASLGRPVKADATSKSDLNAWCSWKTKTEACLTNFT